MRTSVARIVVFIAVMMASPGTARAQARPDFVAVARGGVVLQSSDGGATWSSNTPATAYINGVVSDNRGRFVAVGARGTVLLSENGIAWRVVDSGVDSRVSLSAVAWDDDGTFVAVGSEGAVYTSHDGGLTWQAVASGVKEALHSLDTDRAGTWIAGGAHGIVLRSTDEGAHWQESTLGQEHAIDMASLGDGRWVAVGPMGSVSISSDDGASWTPVQTGVKAVLEGVAADTSGVVVAVGWSGTILRSEDAGASWTAVESGTTRRLAGVAAGAPGHFVAVGWSGTALLSDDGGKRWSAGQSNSRAVVQEVAYNRMPDLVVTVPGLDEACRVVTSVRNAGPATLAAGTWATEAPILRLLRDDEVWAELPLSSLDTARVLLPGGGRLTHTFSETVADSTVVTVVVDPVGEVAEHREGNNRRSATLVCPSDSTVGG